jgi:hypothetical protein
MNMSLCFRAYGGLTLRCTIEGLTIAESAGHVITFQTPSYDSGAHDECDELNGVSLLGKWTTEAGGSGEIEPEVID